MGFLNPLLLAGLALVTLPIVIHLMNRRRAVKQPFPTIEFLLRSEKRLARRLKVKQLLLLALRIGLFILLPLAMARPYLTSEAGSTANERLPTAYVLVLDNSFSMGAGDGAETHHDRALSAIEGLVDELRPWDQVALVTARGEAVAPIPELTEDRGLLRDALEELSGPSTEPGSLPEALSLAREIHATGQLPVRRTYVFTDNRANAWEGAAETAGLAADLPHLGEFEVVDVSRGEPMTNLALGSAGFGDAASGAENEYDLWVAVRVFDPQAAADATPRQVRVDLRVDDDLAGSSLVDVPVNGEATASFRVALDDGALHRAAFVLDAPDGDIPSDNARYLTLHLDREINVLLVNGDPRNVPYRDELFYAERALGVSGGDGSGITSDIVAAERLDAHFADYDVVVLANVERLSRTQVADLTTFVRQGGGLLISAGNRVDPERYNDLFGELLPKPLRSVRELCSPDDPDAGLLATRVARLESTHPVFRVFDLPGGESIQSVSVYSYLLLEPSPLGESRILVSYGDGGPALVERSVGAGRVALLTTSLDRDWTDWPIRTAYLPMMRRLVRHLARRGASGVESEAIVGERYRIDVEAQNPERVIVVGPEQERFVLIPEGRSAGEAVYFEPRMPGPFEVLLDISGAERAFDELMFAANLDVGESDTTPVDPAVPEAFVAAAEDPVATEGTPLPERRVSLWPPLLFIALLALYAESILATRRRLWSRAGARLRAWRSQSGGTASG